LRLVKKDDKIHHVGWKFTIMLKGVTMVTKLIELEDGTLVEIEASPDEGYVPIVGGAAEKVEAAFDKIKPTMVKVIKPISAAWKEINQEMHVEEATVELGLSFEGEGNLYITKAKAGANITVSFTLRPLE
jgi:hypothetical protein